MLKVQDMQKTTFQSERPLLRIGSITFLTGLAIFIISSAFHTSREDPTKHLRVFAEYANSPPWMSAHIGQFVGGITIFTGGFVALFRLLVQSESMTVSVLAWIGFATAIIAASTLSILQAVDGIALKRAVNSWVIAPAEEKMAAFRHVVLNGMSSYVSQLLPCSFSPSFIVIISPFDEQSRLGWANLMDIVDVQSFYV
jgi:hypothetical protein